jgi:hypothetical protein
MKKVLFVLIVLSAVVCTHAQIITIAIEALVVEIDDDADLLEGAIGLNDIIAGTYTYNTDTPDSNPLPEGSDYWHYETPYGVSLNCNGLEFKADPDNVNFLMEIINDEDYGPIGREDSYLFISYNNLSLSNGVGVKHISWQLDDPTGMALDSTALPVTAPTLTDWISPVGLYIMSEKTGVNYDTFFIRSMVYSVELVPEPATLLLLTGGVLLIRKPKT